MGIGVVARIRAEDPVLRILSVATFVVTLGRGVFLSLSTLYLSFVLHLPPAQVALVFGVGSVVGIGGGLVGGPLADRFSSRRIALIALVVGSLALGSYVFASGLAAALVIACVESAAVAIGQTSLSAIQGRAFRGAEGVRARSVLRTLVNIGIGIGSAVASIPLAIGSPAAFRTAFVVAAVVVVAGQLTLVRLPARVDRPRTDDDEPVAAEAPIEPGEESAREAVADAAAESDGESRRGPWRDPRFLLLSLLSAVLGVQFMIQEVGAPLWIAQHTAAPTAIISVLLVLNTVVVIVFTVPLSRGSHRLRAAGRMTFIAGGLLAVACLAYAVAHGLPVLWACLALVAAAAIAAFAEVLSVAGTWGLSFELSNQARMGSYQGVFGTSFALGSAIGPALITATAITWGWPGWCLLAGLFVVASAGVLAVARNAARSRPEIA
jgi:MFS family permease